VSPEQSSRSLVRHLVGGNVGLHWSWPAPGGHQVRPATGPSSRWWLPRSTRVRRPAWRSPTALSRRLGCSGESVRIAHAPTPVLRYQTLQPCGRAPIRHCDSPVAGSLTSLVIGGLGDNEASREHLNRGVSVTISSRSTSIQRSLLLPAQPFRFEFITAGFTDHRHSNYTSDLRRYLAYISATIELC
jgi:hypothetical protein